MDRAGESSTGIQYVAPEEPPSYQETHSLNTPALSPNGNLMPITALPKIQFQSYDLPDSVVSDDKTTVIIRAPVLCTSPEALLGLLYHHATLPPIPTIRVFSKPSNSQPPVFDIHLNALALLNPAINGGTFFAEIAQPEGPCEGGIKQRSLHIPLRSDQKQPSDPSLDAWALRFCADPSPIKSFELTRTVINWDTEYIEGQLRSVVAATNFKGKLEITFPAQHSKIIISQGPDQKKSLFSRLKKAAENRRYDVINVYWPVASAPPGSGPRTGMAQTEFDWCQTWKRAIYNAVLSKRVGYVTAEDWMEASMGLKLPPKKKPWES